MIKIYKRFEVDSDLLLVVRFDDSSDVFLSVLPSFLEKYGRVIVKLVDPKEYAETSKS